MIVQQIKSFDSISQRVIYGLNLIYSEFAPVESENASMQSQEKLHKLMGLMIDKIYDNPSLLNLAENKDEAFQYELYNMKPELNKVYQSVFKGLGEFYKFMYITALYGEITNDCLSIENSVLKKNKASYMPYYNTLLNEIEIEAVNKKDEIAIIAENNLLQSLKLLAEKVPVNINPWRPYALANFACCSFTNNFYYLLSRVDSVNNLNGLLLELQKECLEKNYEQSVNCDMFGFGISFKNKVGGFSLGYNPRKYQPFSFGTLNFIGEKAMLEDFNNLDNDLQKHFIDICRKGMGLCHSCLNCTKGGKKIFAVKIEDDGKYYNLCPLTPYWWNTIDRNLINALFKYHDAQEKYGTKPKKK
jgi:hypothetical protein